MTGCGDDNSNPDAFVAPTPDAFVVPGEDAFTPVVPDAFVPGDAPVVITNDCAGYCAQIMVNCTGDNAQYLDNADCLAQCEDLNWPAGTPGATDGNTVACRIYHGGAPAVMDAAEHCPHAGPSGDGVCGADITFNTMASSAATRVDRMGMPAVATAAVTNKTAYNDGDPSDDAALTFAADQIMTLQGLHTALDDDLTAATLTPCNMSTTEETFDPDGAGPVPALPQCLAQEVLGPGTPRVFQLVIPDTLLVNPTMVSRFPNGRDPDDVVIDITLAAVLLDLTVPGQTAASLVGTNPTANADGEILTTFPYFGVPQPAP